MPLALAADDVRYVAGMRYNLGLAALGQRDYAEAGVRGRAGMIVARQTNLRRTMSIGLDLLACVAGTKGPRVQAARLFGTAEATREAVGLPPWSPADRPLYGPYLADLCAHLDERAFATAWAERRAMALERALVYALEEDRPDH